MKQASYSVVRYRVKASLMLAPSMNFVSGWALGLSWCVILVALYMFTPVRHIRKDERKYYESLLQYSREHLMVSLSALLQLLIFLCVVFLSFTCEAVH